MNNRRYGVGSKWVACVLAGTLAYGHMGGLAALAGGDFVSVAHAQIPAPPPDDATKAQAKAHYGAGKAKFQASDWAGALVEFQAADSLIPTPNTAGFIGLCQDRLGHSREALMGFNRFLLNPPASMKTEGAAIAARASTLNYQLGSQAKVPEARAEGKYRSGDYLNALVDFQAADAIMFSPQTSLYIAKCLDHVGRLADAVPRYQEFIASAPGAMSQDQAGASTRVSQIMAMPGKVHLDTNPAGASVAIDGSVQPSVATPADVDVAPGTHTIRFTLSGYAAREVPITVTYATALSLPQVTLAQNAVVPVPVPVPVPVASNPPPPPPPAQPRSKVPAYVTGGLALAAAGVGTIFGVLALGDKSDFNKNPTSATADNGENHALIADMSFFVAITLGVTSAVLFFTKDNDAPQTASRSSGNPAVAAVKPRKTFTITAAPIVTPHGGGAGALIQF